MNRSTKTGGRGIVGALLAALCLVGCGGSKPLPKMPAGCAELDFGRMAVACVIKVRAAAPSDREAVATACDAEITAREDACYPKVSP